MVLFSTFQQGDKLSSKGLETTSSSALSSSSSIPTIVHLYATPSNLVDSNVATGVSNPADEHAAAAKALGSSSSPASAVMAAAASKHAVLTYQAMEVGLQHADDGKDIDDDDDVLFGVKKTMTISTTNTTMRPDLGIWHCRVDPKQQQQQNNSTLDVAGVTTPSLVDSLLATMIPTNYTMAEPTATTTTSVATITTTTSSPTVKWPICFTVDLSVPALVEPSLLRLSQTLIRYLVSSASGSSSNTNDKKQQVGASPATTSLKLLQSNTFGLAPNDDTNLDKNKQQSQQQVEGEVNPHICLMIAAILPSMSTATTTVADPVIAPTSNTSSTTATTSAIMTYEEQQAQALVLYHLRRYAAAINAILVFVNANAQTKKNKLTSSPSMITTTSSMLPSISKKQLWQLWQDLSLGKPVWKQADDGVATTTTENSLGDPATASNTAESSEPPASVDMEIAAPPAIYGPGHHHEELIESVLLRNASCPGHWDAAKDSLWVALPVPLEVAGSGRSAASAANTPTTKFGDDDWLMQLRDSIAAAVDPKGTTAAGPAVAGGSTSGIVATSTTTTTTSSPTKTTSKSAGGESGGSKSSEQDTGVASYFESLLKKS